MNKWQEVHILKGQYGKGWQNTEAIKNNVKIREQAGTLGIVPVECISCLGSSSFLRVFLLSEQALAGFGWAGSDDFLSSPPVFIQQTFKGCVLLGALCSCPGNSHRVRCWSHSSWGGYDEVRRCYIREQSSLCVGQGFRFLVFCKTETFMDTFSNRIHCVSILALTWALIK